MTEPDKKQHILDQSRQLFEKYGYQKTTLTDIARSLGKVKSAIYYYFSGKEEIFACLVEAEAEQFLGKLIRKVATVESPSEQLRMYVDTRVNLMLDLTARYQFLKADFFELIPIVEAHRKACDQAEITFVHGLLVRANDQENAGIAKPELYATLLMQSLKGLEIQMFVTDSVRAHLENRAAFIDYILHGVLQKN